MSYATIEDLRRYGLPETATVGVPDATLEAELEAASSTADAYLRGRFNLPLLSWGTDITMRVAHIAAYNIMRNRGFAPEAGSDVTIKEAYYEAVGFPDRPGSGWFPAVQRQAIHPDVTETATGADAHPFPQIRTASRRGW